MALAVAMREHDVALIQEPWIYKGKVMGLGDIGGKLIYSTSPNGPRTCIIVKNNLNIVPLTNFCSRDTTAAKI